MRPDEPAPAPTPIRWWRLGPWSRNRLTRRGDRYEATLVLLTAVLVALLIPFAAAFGTATHTRLQHQTQALRAGVHHTPAVLLEDTHPAPETTEYSLRAAGNRDSARVRWSTPDGQRTAVVPTDAPAKAGQTITISAGADGNLTGPIPSSRENTIVAVTTACGAWALAAGALLLPTALVHAVFDRNRMRHWAREWNQFDIPPR
ncbi:hypothetical protein EEB14_55500 [Rhodococcus sp. WS4]|nr:hypothetical protein EEB14_55500 [Rhodococcus sp. WS4]